MRLVLFGATGANGKQLLEQALRAGDEVTAVVRSPERLPHPTPKGLDVVTTTREPQPTLAGTN